MSSAVRLWPLALLLIVCAGCARPAPPAPPPPPAGIPGPMPVVRGAIAGRPFAARSVLLWNDEEAAWIAFRPDVPVTDGRFDPRARSAPGEGFVIRVDPAKLQPGRWDVTSANAGRVPGCPVLGASLLLGARPRLVDTGWTLALTITRVVRREPRSGPFTGFNLGGSLDLRFAKPPARLAGRFVAHDILRDDEVAPGQPAVVQPEPPPGAAASPKTVAEPGPQSGARASPSAATSPGRTARKSAAPPRPTPPSR